MATLKGQTIAASYQDLVKRADTYSQTGTNIEIMNDSAVVQPTGLYLESGATTDNVGIGVADPDATLEILDTTTQLKLSYDATNYATFNIAADGLLTITTVDPDGAEADIILAPDGNVGIGVAGAGSRLHVKGSGNTDATEAFRVDNSDNGFALIIEDDYQVHSRMQTIGVNYVGNDAPANGLIVEGNVGIGTASIVATGGDSMTTQIANTGGSSGLSLIRYSNDAGMASLYFGATNSATIGTVGTAVVDNDGLGRIIFTADDGTDLGTQSVKIQAEVDDASPAASSIGGALTFHTAAGVSSDDLTERMRIDKNGDVTFARDISSDNFQSMLKITENLDNRLRPGFYRCESGCTNQPLVGGLYNMIVTGNGTNVVAQYACNYNTSVAYVRAFNVSWSAWTLIT